MSFYQNSTKGDGLEIISFHLGDQVFSVNIMSVREIRGWAPVTPLAHSPNHVLGVINLRGTVIPVIDMAIRLGLPPIEPTERSAIIVADTHGQLVGLLVEYVSDMITVDPAQMQTVPEVGASAVQTMTSAIISQEDAMISHLDLGAVLEEIGQIAA
ncbi:chemotaxis protein CheW [Pseudohoeflea coraliihabitans]|uniref:Chemotaxis protein CheW n=1 Tax=Pseudohoeflea coraliihabitans TaxID=2860393 RepID=A0ABS6WM97_9HYPH|nr:chemotaxis protein CheW [Pseudohoeflea sp. DP4N28-3]MBW3097074.1 chemotaxis protein CheW [Pseudohoeflea sp. DP4N28-3]